MKKIFIITFLLALGLIAFTKASNAAFLIIDEHGNLVWQVLSRGTDDDDEDKKGEERKEEGEEFRVEVKTQEERPGREMRTEVKIKTEDGRVKLRVSTPSGETEMDVTELKEDIIRIRERAEEQEIRIRARGDRLEIRQKGVGALTHFPISVNPGTNELTVTTPSGIRIVTILPSVAVASILQSNIMDRVLAARELTPQVSPAPTEIATEEAELEEEPEQEVELVEEDGQLSFKIRGVKDVRFLNLISFETPITALVSAQTGETLQVSRPWFLTLFGFLFAQ